MKASSPAGGARPLFAAALAALLATAIVAPGASAQDGKSFEFNGTSSTVTPAFEVTGPWILDWRIYSDFPQSMSVEIALLNATTGMHQGEIKQTKQIGTGVKLFRESGTYKLRIDSDLARWQVLIKEVSEEEAARYTPKEKEGMLDKVFHHPGDPGT